MPLLRHLLNWESGARTSNPQTWVQTGRSKTTISTTINDPWTTWYNALQFEMPPAARDVAACTYWRAPGMPVLTGRVHDWAHV